MPKSRKTIEKTVAAAIRAAGLEAEEKKLRQFIMDGGEHRAEAFRQMKFCGTSDIMDALYKKR